MLLRPDHIGDVLLGSSAVALLRESLPTAHLTYLVGPWSLDAARHGPAVDRLLTLPFPGFARRANANLLAPYALLVREAMRLRRERYDLAIVLRADHWWGALLTLVAGIPRRIGGDFPESAPLLTHVRRPPAGQPVAEQALDLARLALRASGQAVVEPSSVRTFQVTAPERAEAARLWMGFGVQARLVVGIHPNAGAALKSWPVDCWAGLADRLIEQERAVLLIGAPGDAPLLAAIQARMTHAPAGIACGQALGVSAALYERCVLVVGVDSGAAHLAAAVGTATVRLYGPASSAVFGPWPARPDQRVLVADGLACIPCGYLEAPPCGATTLPACLVALEVDQVLNAIGLELARN